MFECKIGYQQGARHLVDERVEPRALYDRFSQQPARIVVVHHSLFPSEDVGLGVEERLAVQHGLLECGAECPFFLHLLIDLAGVERMHAVVRALVIEEMDDFGTVKETHRQAYLAVVYVVQICDCMNPRVQYCQRALVGVDALLVKLLPLLVPGFKEGMGCGGVLRIDYATVVIIILCKARTERILYALNDILGVCHL